MGMELGAGSGESENAEFSSGSMLHAPRSVLFMTYAFYGKSGAPGTGALSPLRSRYDYVASFIARNDDHGR